MSRRRILSLWFPRLAAERALRAAPGLDAPLAIVAEESNARVLSSLSAGAEAAGLRRGQALRDALAICPGLVTRPADPAGEAAFLAALRRWAGRYSPWVAEEPPESLALDITGCAHLFGGEAAMLARIEEDCTALGLGLSAGIAGTPGAAWALARFAGHGAGAARSGDAIAQEARATRSRAGRRHWTKGGAAPPAPVPAPAPAGRIAPPDGLRAALAPLPAAALRLPDDTVTALARLGLRTVGDIAGLPRAALARRFGPGLMLRLDQALGLVDEPLSPAPPAPHFAVRLTLPEPIGLEDDILAALDRLLAALMPRLEAAGRGARRLRLELRRADGGLQALEVGLARPGRDAAAIRGLFALKTGGVEAGFGIDALRLEAVTTEPLAPRAHKGHLDASAEAGARAAAAAGSDAGAGADAALADTISRIGARIGLEAITRDHPADSHIPEKTAHPVAAAWAGPATDWPRPAAPRPLLLFRPEPVTPRGAAHPPERFRWRRREFRTASAAGPERIAPEWWLDDPGWRSGPRDYWRVETEDGARLWLFHAHGGLASGGWFCHGAFA